MTTANQGPGRAVRYLEQVSHQRFMVGAIAFNAWTFDQALSCVLRPNAPLATTSGAQPGTAIHFANAYNIALAQTNDRYQALINESDYVFIDGTPVVWAARLTRRSRKAVWMRIYGPSFMRAVLAESNRNHRHFLLGGTQEVLDRLHAAIADAYPQARIVGSYSPPFSDEVQQSELDERDRIIAAASPTHIWVGLGTPKQDYEVFRLARIHPAKCLAVGAAFDYLSGNVKEAPALLQKTGLQWLHRLAQEPHRLLRRYAWGNPVFMYSVISRSADRGFEQ